MSSKTFKILMFSAALGLSACGNKDDLAPTPIAPLSQQNPIIAGSKLKPTNEQLDNFSELEKNKRSVFQITLKEDALKQSFLLTVAEVSGAPTPTGQAMANKIVFFEKKGGSLFMFESLDGKLSTDSVETRVLLAEFPITKDQDGSITFDFKKGMHLVFEKSSMFISDSETPDSGDTVYQISDSYIKSVEIRGKYIFIDQIARIDIPATAKTPAQNVSRQLKYTLSTYLKNENFKSKMSNKQKKVGYFEVHPVLEAGNGKSTVNIIKFDISKPVTYHVSNNVPELYKQAVNDGIKYWNRVFGKDIIKVATLPKGVSVHEPNYNIVQWLHWDTAGFAYANMMGDPLTGENLQSHVYMTSVFGKGGLRRAKQYLRRYKATSIAKNNDISKHSLKIVGFDSAHVCSFNYERSMYDLAGIIKRTEELASNNKDAETTDEEKEAIFTRFSQDYVRQVVAHEIGHTLGLRHNFAGSLASNITPKLYDTVAKVYFLTGKLIPGMVPGGTVMDYTPSMISSMLGAHIRLNRPALSYDKQAIEFGYTDKKANEIEFDVFCTDTHKGKGVYQDCKVWDLFTNPIDAAFFDMKNVVPFMAFTLVSKFPFLDANFKSEGVESTLTNLENIALIKLDPRAEAQVLISRNFDPLLAMSSLKAEFVAIRNTYNTIGSLEEDEYLAKTRTFQEKSIKAVGGIAKLFIAPLVPVNFRDTKVISIAADLMTEFEKQFHKVYKNVAVDEKQAIDSMMAAYFDIFEKEIAMEMMKKLNLHTFANREEGFAKALTSAVDDILFTEGQQIVGTTAAGTVIKEYLFQYNKKGMDLRLRAAKLVKRNFFPYSPSYMRAQNKLILPLKQKHMAAMSSILVNTTEDDLSDDLYDWMTFEKKRLKILK